MGKVTTNYYYYYSSYDRQSLPVLTTGAALTKRYFTCTLQASSWYLENYAFSNYRKQISLPIALRLFEKASCACVIDLCVVNLSTLTVEKLKKSQSHKSQVKQVREPTRKGILHTF